MKLLNVVLISFLFTKTNAQNIGIGTTSPSDKLHISVPAGEDPLRVQINLVTKLRVYANGGLALGTGLTVPPANGLLVGGVIQPQNGIETPTKLVIESTGDSIIVNAGGSKVIVAANGNITIQAASGKIVVDAGTTLELKSATALNLVSLSAITMTAPQVNISGLIRFNNGSRRISGIGDTVSGSDGSGVITTGTPNVFTQ